MRGLDFFLLVEAGEIGIVPLAGVSLADGFGLAQIFRRNADIGHVHLGRNGKFSLMTVIIGGDFRIRGLGICHEIGSRNKYVVRHPLFTQEVVAVLRFCRIMPRCCSYQCKELLPQQVFAHVMLVLRGRDALHLQNALVRFGIKLPLGVLEGRDLPHGNAQLKRRHGNARASGFLTYERLADQITQHLTPKALTDLLARCAGVVAHHGFFRIAIGKFKITHGNGFAVNHGDHIACAPVFHTANAPENKDKDNEAKSQFDAKRLRIGTDILKHAYSEMRYFPKDREAS